MACMNIKLLQLQMKIFSEIKSEYRLVPGNKNGMMSARKKALRI
jgi:hypothetical protein